MILVSETILKILSSDKIKNGVRIFHHQAICTPNWCTKSMLATSCGGQFFSLFVSWQIREIY
jgi:hypothetical protein